MLKCNIFEVSSSVYTLVLARAHTHTNTYIYSVGESRLNPQHSPESRLMLVKQSQLRGRYISHFRKKRHIDRTAALRH